MIEALLMLASGPMSKWNDEQPDLSYLSSANMFDVERCLIDIPGTPAPQVFRQPDRPDKVTLLYLVEHRTVGRADLEATGDEVHIRTWRLGKDRVRDCAPPAG